MNESEIIIIGAGACGLMAARELSRSGKKVAILEARERIGGRIYSLTENDFSYIAEAGAEFIHGDLPITISLVKEAGLTLISSEGQLWNARKGKLSPTHEFISEWSILIKKLKAVKEDLPIGMFLEQNFPKEKYSELHSSIKGFVEGYDAADPKRASTFALRDEWMSENEATQFRIAEGYEALIAHLKTACINNGTTILLNAEVQSIQIKEDQATVTCTNGKEHTAFKVIVTVPLPVLKKISFTPSLPKKLKAASEIGYGKVIKFIFHFKERWWIKIHDKDLNKAGFIFSNEAVPTWWTQYPKPSSVLTGWLAGPNAEKFTKCSSEELFDLGLTSLSKIFNLEKDFLKKELLNYKIINWGTDPFALGAYAYATPETIAAKEELLHPVNNILYFSGEALYTGTEMGTVEAALASGLKTAKKILNISY